MSRRSAESVPDEILVALVASVVAEGARSVRFEAAIWITFSCTVVMRPVASTVMEGTLL